MLRLYGYAKCSTCRKAMLWLEDNGIAFQEIAIRETPPSEQDLEEMLAAKNGQLRSLFNTSGMDYRALGLKDRLPAMSRPDAFTLLRGNSMLIKRPFLIGKSVHLLGFRADEWKKALRSSTSA